MDLENFGKKAESLRCLGVKVSQHGVVIAHKVWDE